MLRLRGSPTEAAQRAHVHPGACASMDQHVDAAAAAAFLPFV